VAEIAGSIALGITRVRVVFAYRLNAVSVPCPLSCRPCCPGSPAFSAAWTKALRHE